MAPTLRPIGRRAGVAGRLRGLGFRLKLNMLGVMDLQGGGEDRQLLAGLQSPEALGRFHHAGGRPTQSHPGIAPSFNVAADAANGAVHILNDVGAGERPAQLGRKAETGDGEDLVDALQDAPGDAGGLVLEAAGQIADQREDQDRASEPRLQHPPTGNPGTSCRCITK